MIGVIGDIHGCYFTLKELVSKIREIYPDIDLYSVGDLVDRGNFSCEVFDFTIEQNIKFTPGNHDYMFYYFFKEPNSVLARSWKYNGSEKTLESYEKNNDKIQRHLEIIKNSPLFFNLKECFISHAGISTYYNSILPKNYKQDLDLLKKVAYSDITSEHGILWTRDELVNIGKLQIVGHTRMNEISFKEFNNVVYIDTSAYSGNKLSAVIVEDNKIIESFSVPTFQVDIK